MRRVSSDVLAGAEGGIRFNSNACVESGVWWPNRLAGVLNEDVGRVDRVSSFRIGGRIFGWYSGGRCAGSGLVGRWSCMASDNAAE